MRTIRPERSLSCALSLVVLCSASLTTSLHAQVHWAKGFGTTGPEWAACTAAAPDGSSYLAASNSGQLEANPPSVFVDVPFGEDAIIKMDAEGEIIWAVGFAVSQFTAISVAPDGSVIAIGLLDGDADMDPGPDTAPVTCSTECGFILALSPSGTYLWSGTISGAETMYPSALVCPANGSITLAGWCEGVLDLDPGSATATFNVPSEGMFVLTLNADGSFVRAHTTTGRGRPMSLASTPGGDVLCTGVFDETIDLQPGPASATLSVQLPGYGDIFLVKWDTDGDVVWSRHFAGDGAVDYAEVGLAPNGSVYVSGVFSGALDLDPGTPVVLVTAQANHREIFTVKLNLFGNYSWNRHFGVDAGGVHMAVDDLGDVYLGGGFEGTADVFGTPLGIPDRSVAFLLRLRSNGTTDLVRYARTESPFSGDPGITDIDASVSGQILVAGYFYYYTTVFAATEEHPSDGWQLTGYGQQDMFMAKYNTGIPQVVTDESRISGALKAWPQPAADHLWVDLGSDVSGRVDILVCSSDGRVLRRHQQADASQLVRLELGSLQPGMYVLRTVATGVVRSAAFLKE